MSIKDGKDYLYLIWKYASNRRQYIVGQLTKNGQYEFQYCGEIEDALKVGFTPLVSFEDMNKVYKCETLFPAFSSRLPDKKRRNMNRILEKYGLKEYDSYELLKKSGARSPIDNFQFIDPILNYEDGFNKKFYVAGARHYLPCAGEQCSKAGIVTRGDEVFLERESNNSYDENAIRVIDEQHNVLGYVLRYYAQAFVELMEEDRIQSCHVANVTKDNDCDECISVLIQISALAH